MIWVDLQWTKMTLDDLTINYILTTFWLHSDWPLTIFWLFLTGVGWLVTIVDVLCYIHLRWSCSHFKIWGSPQALRPATIYKLCLMWAGVGLFLLSHGRAGSGCAYTGDSGRWGQFGEEPSSKATFPTLPYTFYPAVIQQTTSGRDQCCRSFNFS